MRGCQCEGGASPIVGQGPRELASGRLAFERGLPGLCSVSGLLCDVYIAEALLLGRGLSFSSHAAVIAAFGKEFAKTGLLDARFHRYLLDAQDFRNLGDYGIGQPVTAKQARQVFRWAAEFLEVAERHLSAGQGK